MISCFCGPFLFSGEKLPIKECKLPDGSSGYKWGDEGKCYADRNDAEKQAAAAYSHGYVGDKIIAFDRSTVRTIDGNGHLHVSLTNISKANICPYFGKEIPGWKELGLASDEVYQMLRHPDELKKAAKTFDGVPVLDVHIPVHAEDHPTEKVVGASGTDTIFDGEYLKNSLVVWTSDAIKKIESNEQREISCSYSYDADMTPGTHKGIHYDGIMRNIKANHVALVPLGRAGHDVLVADSLNEEVEAAMKKKSYSKSVLKQMAEDAKVDTVDGLLSLLAADEEKEPEKKEEKKADDEETDEEKEARLKKEAEEKKAEDEEETKAKAAEQEKKDCEIKKAMDAAIEKAKEETKAEMRAQHEAEEIVRPWVGNLVAMDSAEAVYKAALEIKQVSVEGIHPSAYRALVQAHMQSGKQPVLAQDAKSVNDFADRFPGAKRINRR